jgi:hypothetical protein
MVGDREYRLHWRPASLRNKQGITEKERVSLRQSCLLTTVRRNYVRSAPNCRSFTYAELYFYFGTVRPVGSIAAG